MENVLSPDKAGDYLAGWPTPAANRIHAAMPTRPPTPTQKICRQIVEGTARDLVGIVGVTLAADALDFGFKLGKALIHIGRQIHVCVFPFCRQALKFLLCGIVGGDFFLRKLYLARVGVPHAVGVGPVDMSRDPFPPLGLLNLGSHLFELVQHKPVQQRGVLIEAVATLGKQVADDVAARLGMGFRR